MYFHRAVQLVLIKSGRELIELAPYVVLGVLASEALRHTPLTRVLARAFVRAPLVSVLLAAVLGIVSPLCTYGTVPVVLELYGSGVPLAPLVTFLSASSLMNPQLFILTWGGIGPGMALVRLAAVLLFAVLLGALVHRLPARIISNSAVLRAQEEERASHVHGHPRPFAWRGFLRQSYDSLMFVGYYIIIGILLGAIIEVFVPQAWIVAVFHPGKWASVALAAVLGVPLYACGGGTIPLVRSLMEQGMSRGAALAFFVAGPATRVPPLLALAAILRPWFIGAYVAALLAYSLAAGMLYGG